MGATPSKVSVVKLNVSGTPTEIGDVRSYVIETALGTIDASTISTLWKKFLVGQASWSGTLELFYDPTDTTQAELVSNALAGVLCTMTIHPLGSGSGKPQLVGSCNVTNMRISGATEDAVGLSVSYQGTGPLMLSNQS